MNVGWILNRYTVSATDPDCGVNAMVNYTLGESFAKSRHFEVRSGTGEVCISGELDFETREVYEFPVIATDRGKPKQVNATILTQEMHIVHFLPTSESNMRLRLRVLL
uniref:Cadherin domain-containing protein n=1 Tax=Timema genevievae TaxID=629358 RepID=A0A7R9PGM3_TIMGE|nr:unnamed protein product [Timema genevievae]